MSLENDILSLIDLRASILQVEIQKAQKNPTDDNLLAVISNIHAIAKMGQKLNLLIIKEIFDEDSPTEE